MHLKLHPHTKLQLQTFAPSSAVNREPSTGSELKGMLCFCPLTYFVPLCCALQDSLTSFIMGSFFVAERTGFTMSTTRLRVMNSEAVTVPL